MFTGIVTDIGRITEVREREGAMHLSIACGFDANDVTLGESIAVSGVCLTVTGHELHDSGTLFNVTLSPETIRRTAQGRWSPGNRVNLERALRLVDRLGGHIVTGHVDDIARITAIRETGQAWDISFEAPQEFARYLAPKGSVTLDGISLTVNAVEGQQFRVTMIPHTLEATTAGTWQAGDEVHMEIDLIARYLEKLMGKAA